MGHLKNTHSLKKRLLWLTAVVLVLPLLVPAGVTHREKSSPHQVHIAFGFHANLSHSFRNDTNDESGFGKDIRIIRDIIDTLDDFNAQGVPVMGVWDFDNLFSLQDILPRYAPDIIEDIQRRVNAHNDEIILMSYNNGLASAMTHQELEDAVRWSITNPWQSGVHDLFGKYTPIVRPQEMMTTPGNFSIYKNHGVQAVALYYSATPFDAFRMFSRPLTREEAHNPMRYRHPDTREEMIIIPTYHFGDVMEHVSLRHWVQELHDLQDRGELNRDALIFINFDADSELWSGVDLPWIVDWLPNTNGLEGMVNAVRDLPYVRFTRLEDYLAQHPPAGTFYFSQDTADGSFNGYNSWAEKAVVQRYWTTIEHSRHVRTAALDVMARFDPPLDRDRLHNLMTFADMTRLKALSTTNFGMAAPFVALQREQEMAALMDDLAGYAAEIEQLIADGMLDLLRRQPPPLEEIPGLIHLDTLAMIGTQRDTLPEGHRFLNISQPQDYSEAMRLWLAGPGEELRPVIDLGAIEEDGHGSRRKLYIPGPKGLADGCYHLYGSTGPLASAEKKYGRPMATRTGMTNQRLDVSFDNGTLEGIYLDGVRQVQTGSLIPYLRWHDRTFNARLKATPESPSSGGRSASLRMTGMLPGPSGRTLSDGHVDYRLTVMADRPYLWVQGDLRYPSTRENDILKATTPGLIRRADLQWQEVAPMEVRFAPRADRKTPAQVIKRNYLGVTTHYALDYFRFSDRNLDLDNINNHVTESYIGLVSGDAGMGMAMDADIRSNFAFAPMKLRYSAETATFTTAVNPFGTYHGRQYRPRTWGNGNGYDATLLAGEQFASAGPTYNGEHQRFSLLLAFFNGRRMPEEIRKDLIDFAHPPMVISAARHKEGADRKPRPSVPRGFAAAYDHGTVRFNWDSGLHAQDHYRVKVGRQPGRYDTVYPAVGNSLSVSRYRTGQPFVPEGRYYAVIEKVSANNQVSRHSPEITFTITPAKPPTPEIPLKLSLRVIWATLQAWLKS